MENSMEHEIETLGPFKADVYGGIWGYYPPSNGESKGNGQ